MRMTLPLSTPIASKLLWLTSVGSTNDALVELATGVDGAMWPDLSVVATDNQVDGKGRLDRVWVAPAGRCLAVSILLRPKTGLPAAALGWIPLLAGAAMTSAVRSVIATRLGESAAAAVNLKWPNDVLIDGRKVCGILGAVLPSTAVDWSDPAVADSAPSPVAGVVIGAGVNITLSVAELPVSTATSLAIVGATGVSADEILSRYLEEFASLYRDLLAHNGDAVASGLHRTVSALCGTLNRVVRVELPGGAIETGTAAVIDDDGRLGIDRDTEATRFFVSAGDITHLRV